jgi:hypothetical protein
MALVANGLLRHATDLGVAFGYHLQVDPGEDAEGIAGYRGGHGAIAYLLSRELPERDRAATADELRTGLTMK